MNEHRAGYRRAGRWVAGGLLVGVGLMGACSSDEADDGGGTTSPPSGDEVLTGADAMGDWTSDAPGVKRKITVEDLPAPFATESSFNQPEAVVRPAGAWPMVPAGFTVKEFATGLEQPRIVRTAPNGDVFVVDSEPGVVRVLRDTDGDGVSDATSDFASGLNRPFGLAFYPSGSSAPTHVYIGNTDSVVRYPYTLGDIEAQGEPETLVNNLPSGQESVGGGGHWTRDIAFSADNQRMFVSVGSKSNADDDPSENRRANILSFTVDGQDEVVHASGIRNPVGLAIEPSTGDLWTAVNERDELGDDLVPDYVTQVREGGFYGWPWYYLGQNQDPRHEDVHPNLRASSIVPDVLVQAHSATLGLAFYTGQQFPDDYRGDLFVAAHGSWNRSKRTGYKVVRIPIENGAAAGYYEDFMVGFVTDEGNVWGRPVGVAVARDGALLVTDDQSGTVWRVSHE
ncbi:PQQ-dependent sugar dehydrogenase [Chondromyces apiculatus]|uniref:L-sorbosone dehydrogenase n=1 Tax=Chondromyces apiculatus DSM 436 TaxID=1192034 RepID=A0A017SW91_9BACT|nr:sorbosone dehydrogenase family protein [Chondromyces apiculatus]EYF00536.1 L-sorbosone dehydrogenase [Chondromyces apiculatus DSM 436]